MPSFDFTGALKSGMTPQSITSFLSSKGQGQLAQTYFNQNPTPLTTANNNPASALSYLKSFAQDAAKTLIVKPATRIAEAGVSAVEPLLPKSTQQTIEANLQKPQTSLGVTVEPQKTGQAGALQIAGDAAKSASYLAGGEGAGGLVDNGVLKGAVAGAEAGGLGAGGNALQADKPTAGGVLKATGEGAAAGAVIGGAIPAAAEGIKAGQSAFADLASQPETPAIPKTSPLTDAETARTQAGKQGVQALQSMNDQVGGFKSKLGTDFQQGATNIEQANPGGKLNLTTQQLSNLNALKENKSFVLPKYLESDTAAIDNGTGKFGNVKLSPAAQAEFEAAGKSTQASLSPTQAQDLITQLNKSTFKETSAGLQVDQQRIALTNEIKSAASKAFGPEWDKVYSNYSQGINAVQKLDDIVTLDKNATASDVNSSLNSILKLGKTPEGKIILQNALDEFKITTGIDLSQPTQAIHQILDKQLALEQAQSTAAKPSFAHSLIEPRYLGRRLVGGTVSIGLLYPALRAIMKAAQGK
jgi:hypothetical protein